jgi:ELWxxDGT repeat protein
MCSNEISTTAVLAYFSASAGATGCELYRTDGTANGSYLVKDISDLDGSNPTNMRLLGSNLIFLARGSSAQGRELWKSDGSAAGTVLLRELKPGSEGIQRFETFNQASTLVTAGFYYFVENFGGVYRTDGSSAGTREIGSVIGNGGYSRPIGVANDVVLSNNTQYDLGGFGTEPARAPISTPSFSEILKNTASDAGHSLKVVGTRGFVALNQAVLFPALNTNGIETTYAVSPAGTVEDLSVVSQSIFTSGSRAYLAQSKKLLVSDGTAAGTQALSPILPDIRNMMATPFGVCFFARTRDTDNDGELTFNDNFDLWRSDGSEAGTMRITSNQTLPSSFKMTLSLGWPSVLLGGDVLVVGQDISSNLGEELYRINATTGAARLVRDINPGSARSSISGFLAVGNVVYFSATDRLDNQELWKTDDTTQGTVQVGEINLSGGSNPAYLQAMGSTVFFTAFNPFTGRDLYKTDGATISLAADFSRVVDTISGGFAVSGDRAYFAGIDAEDNGARLYFTTGKTSSVRQLGGIHPILSMGNAPQEIIAGPTPGSVIFSGWDASHGRELWLSDGTDVGTRRISDVAPGAKNANPNRLTLVGNRVYFSADDTTIGREPYVFTF